MNDTDNKIDILISRHLGKQLDRHVGRAQRAFLAEVGQKRAWYIPRYWAAAAVLLIAATLAGVFALKNLFTAPTRDETQIVGVPKSQPQPLMPIAQTVAWQTLPLHEIRTSGTQPSVASRTSSINRLSIGRSSRRGRLYRIAPDKLFGLTYIFWFAYKAECHVINAMCNTKL